MAEFHVGPLPAEEARAWLASAHRILDWIRSRPDLAAEVPPEVDADFDELLAQWEESAHTDPFEWAGRMDDERLRHLLAHWHRTASIVVSHAAEAGTPLPPPETERFRTAAIEGASKALEAGDDPAAFGTAFRALWDLPELPEAPVPPAPPPTIRVLVVDDDEDIRLLLRSALSIDQRFEVVGEAADGQEAVDAVAGGCPDVVVLDVNMPRLAGSDALPLLREACPHTKVVVYTSNADDVVLTSGLLGRGAATVVSKGKPLALLLSALADASA